MAATTTNIRYAPEDPSLPKPWRGLIDGKTGYIYFWNPETNVTQYQKPGTLQIKPDSPDKCVTVATYSSVQVQQSSQVPNQEITTIDDNDRNGRGNDGRPKPDCGGRSDQNYKSVTGWMFREGTAVEVSFQKENFSVWHVGTVMKATVNDKCLVKYQCPGGVNEHKIQEFAYSPNIRPSPPSLEDNDYLLLEKVEAYFECCWWSGTIKRLLQDRRYIVGIKHAKKEMTFEHANLRPCMVWTDGKWINEAKYDKRPGVLTRQSENLNRQQKRAEEHQARNGFVSAEKKDNGGVHVEEIVDKECLTKEVDVSLKEVKGARSAKNCDISLKKDQKKQSREQGIHTVDSIEGSTEGDNSSKRKRGRPKVLPKKKQIGERSKGVKMDMQDSCVGDEAKLSAENDCVISTAVDEIPNNGDFHGSTKKNMAVITSDRKLRSGVRKHNGVVSRTANIPLLDDQAGETDPSKIVNRLENSVSNEHREMSRTVDSESRYQGNQIDYAKDDNMMIDEVGDINDDQPLSTWLNVLPPVGSDDPRALPVQDQCANAEGRHDDFRTPPLAKVDAMKPSPLQRKDCPNPGDLPIRNLNGCTESNDKGCELGTPAIVGIDTMENESLPFVKCSPLWKNIDSMELYRTQKPHFSPLVKFREETREGLAIGMLVNFSNLVENTSKLQFSSDIAIIERSLETLAEFQSHGFDVENVRACLTQLLSKKRRAEELQKEYEDIGSEICNSFDDGKLDEEINQLYQKFREIEQKLVEAKLKKEMREKTLLALRTKRDVVAETVQSLQVEFENIVGTLYGK